MIKILITFIAIFLNACTNQPIKTETQIVEVPKLYCPKPVKVEKPFLAIDTISDDDSIGDLAVKYKASIKALQLYSESLEKSLELYE